MISLLFNGAVNNARTGGAGQAPGDPLTDGGYAYQAWSGPGASFGPPGGGLDGLIDQGNPVPVDGLDNPFNHLDNGTPVAPSGGGHHGGGGGGGGLFTFQPYNGVGFTSSFVGMDPTQPGAVSHPATIIHHIVNAGTPAKNPSSPGSLGGGGNAGGGTLGGGGGRAGGKIPGVQYGGTPPKVPAGGSTRPDGRIFDATGRTIYIPGPGGPGAGGPAGGPDPGAPISPGNGAPFGGQVPAGGIVKAITGGDPISSITPTDRDSHGLNFNNIDKSTPGWVHDPTLGIQNTAGMPLGTLPDPRGMTADQYAQALHDMGMGQEDIASMMSPYGFQVGNPQQGTPSPGAVDPYWPGAMTGAPMPPGWEDSHRLAGNNPGSNDNVSWGWGTGPVVGDVGGGNYHFANQGVGGPNPRAGEGGGGGASMWSAGSPTGFWESVFGRGK